MDENIVYLEVMHNGHGNEETSHVREYSDVEVDSDIEIFNMLSEKQNKKKGF